MAKVVRGEIWWANLDPTLGREQAGTRPVLILSQSVFNRSSQTVIAAALTSQEPQAQFPLTLELRSAKLQKRSWVKISQVRVLALERLSSRITSVSVQEMRQILEGLNEIIGEDAEE